MRELDRKTDGILSKKRLNEAERYPGSGTYQRHFGSWNAAKEQAGLDPVPEGQPPRYSDEELIEMLRELAEQCDPPIGEHDVEEAEDIPALSTFENRFGSWNKAKQAAGLETRERGEGTRGHSYSDEELLEKLRELSRQHDGPVTRQMMNRAEGYPSPTTYERRFGSWSKAKEKALKEMEDSPREE